MDWMTIIYMAVSLFSGIGGTLFVGKMTKKERQNDILQKMQNSINNLVIENGEHLKKIIDLSKKNMDFEIYIKELELKDRQREKEINELKEIIGKMKNHHE